MCHTTVCARPGEFTWPAHCHHVQQHLQLGFALPSRMLLVPQCRTMSVTQLGLYMETRYNEAQRTSSASADELCKALELQREFTCHLQCVLGIVP